MYDEVSPHQIPTDSERLGVVAKINLVETNRLHLVGGMIFYFKLFYADTS
jgi:hypothetical protein